MTNNEKLARFLMDSPRRDLASFLAFIRANDHPVRVKEVGSGGKVVINLNEKDGWIDPIAWLSMYRVACKNSYNRERDRLQNIYPQDEFSKIVSSGPQPNFRSLSEIVKDGYVRERLRSILSTFLDKLRKGEVNFNLMSLMREFREDFRDPDTDKLFEEYQALSRQKKGK